MQGSQDVNGTASHCEDGVSSEAEQQLAARIVEDAMNVGFAYETAAAIARAAVMREGRRANC